LILNGLQRILGKRENGPTIHPEPGTADESLEAVSTDTSAGEGPDFANSSRFHSAPLQRQPVNRSTGPRFHSAPLHRLKSSKTGCPGAMSA